MLEKGTGTKARQDLDPQLSACQLYRCDASGQQSAGACGQQCTWSALHSGLQCFSQPLPRQGYLYLSLNIGDEPFCTTIDMPLMAHWGGKGVQARSRAAGTTTTFNPIILSVTRTAAPNAARKHRQLLQLAGGIGHR